MMSFNRFILAAALLLLAPQAHGQGTSFPAGTIWGNDTAAARPGKAATVTAILDRAFGSTRGSLLARGASGWALVVPGTIGLPWVSNGSGADASYQILGTAGGGTGFATYAIGDILYASTTAVLSRLADVATGNALISGGVGVAPSWGKIGITTHVSGLGTGVGAALAINIGSAGAPVLFNGAGGTPSSMTLTSATGLPIGGLTGLGTGVGAALAVNQGSAGAMVQIIATGTIALATGAIASGACTSAQTASATGTATTDIIRAGFNADPVAITGYIPLAMLAIIPYPTANTVNIKVCNNTASSITPGAVTLNWRVER